MSQGKFGTELHLKRGFVQDIVEGKYRRLKIKKAGYKLQGKPENSINPRNAKC